MSYIMLNNSNNSKVTFFLFYALLEFLSFLLHFNKWQNNNIYCIIFYLECKEGWGKTGWREGKLLIWTTPPHLEFWK